MNPYLVLGVAPTASTDEIEAAYHQALRAHHPDLHQGGAPEDLARAEAVTRQLNEAMALIRGGWRGPAGRYDSPPPWPPPPGSGDGAAGWNGQWGDGFQTGPDADWFGNPLGPRPMVDSVSCPMCAKVFTEAPAYRTHLERVHHLTPTGSPAPRAGRRDRLRWLTWLPAPTLSLFVVLVLYWMLVTSLLPTPLAIAGIWVGVVAFGLLLNKAVRDRHRW